MGEIRGGIRCRYAAEFQAPSDARPKRPHKFGGRGPRPEPEPHIRPDEIKRACGGATLGGGEIKDGHRGSSFAALTGFGEAAQTMPRPAWNLPQPPELLVGVLRWPWLKIADSYWWSRMNC